jgi:hypothetical protein
LNPINSYRLVDITILHLITFDIEKGVFRKNKRIRTILKFDNVMSVNSKNINLNDKNKFLDSVRLIVLLTFCGFLVRLGGS